MKASGPLAGRTIVVTRAADQAAALAGPLEELGAEVLLVPVVAIADPPDPAAVTAAIEALPTYDWLVLTSANGVDRFDAALRATGASLAGLAKPRVAVVGSETERRLRDLGGVAALVPRAFRAEGLAAAMREAGAGEGTRVLIARALDAREVLPDELRAAGCAVDVVAVYRTAPAAPSPDALARIAAGVDAVTFASGGTARYFVAALAEAGLDAGTVLRGTVLASIGPVTTAALAQMGFEPDVEASEATVTALAEALVAHFAQAP